MNSLHNYSIYNNQIIETYNNYVIASIDHRKVLIYTDDIYFKGEKVQVINSQKEITSLSNFNIFNFKDYMNQKNIKYYLNQDDVIIYKNNSLKRYIYNKINSYNDPYLIKIFYGFSDQSLLISTGLHYSYLNKCLLKVLPLSITNIILLIFSFLFPFKFPLLRILLSNIIKNINNLSRKEKCGLIYLICMLLIPSSIYSLSFIVPYFFNIISFFIRNQNTRKIFNKIFLCFIQFYYFNELNIMNILFFDIYRKTNSLLLVVGITQLLLPFSLKLDTIFNFIENIFSYNIVKLYGNVSNLILILFIICFIYSMNKTNKIYICILLLMYIPSQGYLNPFYSIDFINVGQGDSILLRAPFNKYNTLIDIPKNKEDEVIEYLKSLGIYKINSLIITHEDSDHSGGKDNFIQQFEVEEIINDKKDITNRYYQLLSINEPTYDNENDNSLVYYVNVNNLNYCLMGDVSKKVEEDLINKYDLKCDVLKVGHHGSRTSTSPLFIQKVNPVLAIISVSENNYYGHPHKEVLDNLNKYKINILQTNKHGGISIKSFLNLYFYSTSTKEFGIIRME